MGILINIMKLLIFWFIIVRKYYYIIKEVFASHVPRVQNLSYSMVFPMGLKSRYH